jgi:putative membrane protein
MKKETFAAVATLATAMFMAQGTFGQAQSSDQLNRSADTSSQADQNRSSRDSSRDASSRDASARQAGSREGREGQQNMDQEFVKHAMMANQFEIQAGQLAEQRAEDQNIKQFAQMLVKDHQQNQQQLQQAAQGIQQGSQSQENQLGPVHQAMLQELQKKQGRQFDRAFLYGNVAGHTKAVLMFRDAAQELQNPQLKQYAQQTLLALRKHLEEAQRLAQFDTAEQAGAREHGSAAHDRSSSDQSTERIRSDINRSSSERGSRGITDGNSDTAGRSSSGSSSSGTSSGTGSGTGQNR